MYSWEITGVKVKDIGDKKDVICSISFRKSGTDRFGRTGVFVGTIPVDTSSADTDNFVGFDSLIQNDIINWLQQIITPEFDNHINEHIDNQILQNSAMVEKTIPFTLETPEEIVEEVVEEIVAEPVVVTKKTKTK